MKIDRISARPVGPVQTYAPRAGGLSGAQRPRVARRFDTISIGENGRSSFQLELKSRLTQEVRASATPGRLANLSEQVQSGTYEPDAVSIARAMLRIAEEA